MPKPTGSVIQQKMKLKAHLLSLEDPIEGFQQRSDEELKQLRDGALLPMDTDPATSSPTPQAPL